MTAQEEHTKPVRSGLEIAVHWLIAVVVVAALGLGALLLFARAVIGDDEAFLPGPQLECGDLQLLEEQGGRLRDAVEAYRAEHGRNPVSLAEVGIAPAELHSKFGDWGLLCVDDGRYELSVGDYGRNGFALWWSQGATDWYLDM